MASSAKPCAVAPERPSHLTGRPGASDSGVAALCPSARHGRAAGEEVAGTGAAVALGAPAAASLPGWGSAACPRPALHSTLGAPSHL